MGPDAGPSLDVHVEYRSNVPRGATNEHGVRPVGDRPPVGLVVIREVVAVERDAYGRLFAGLKRDGLEADEFTAGMGDWRRRLPRIHLDDLLPSPFADVAEADSDLESVIGLADVRVAVLDGRVRQPVSEGEQRLDVPIVKVSVADEDAFVVVNCVVYAGEGRFVSSRIVRGGAAERDWEPTTRIGVAEQDRRERLAVGLAGIPGLKHGVDRVEPGKLDGAAGLEDNDGPAGGVGDG